MADRRASGPMSWARIVAHAFACALFIVVGGVLHESPFLNGALAGWTAIIVITHLDRRLNGDEP